MGRGGGVFCGLIIIFTVVKDKHGVVSCFQNAITLAHQGCLLDVQ